MKLLSSLLAITFITSASGCGIIRPQTSEIKHDAGRFMNSVSPYQWAEISEAKYQENESNVLANDHPMTMRLQAWADAIREDILRTTPALEIAPRPLLRVATNEQIDAHIATVDICVDIPMTFDPLSKAPVEADSAYLQGSEYLTSGPRRSECQIFPGDQEAAYQLVKWALRSLKDCSVSLVNSRLELTPSCNTSLTHANYSGFQLAVTENHLTVYTGLLEKLTEDQVVSTLAHELAHYYMGHVNAEKSLYNYFYVRDAANAGKKPVALADTDALYKLAIDVQTAVFGGADASKTEPLIEEATQKKIGFYTMEQEADDLATEAVYRLGLNPESMVSTAIQLAQLNEQPVSEKCSANYKNGFASPVWIGDLADPHHDFCYRAYNSFNEIREHEAYFARFKEISIPVIQAELTWENAIILLKTK